MTDVPHYVKNRQIDRVFPRSFGDDLPRSEALKVLKSLGDVLESGDRWFFTMDGFRFRYENVQEGNRLGQIVSLRTGEHIAFVHYGQGLEVDIEAYKRYCNDPKGIHTIQWISSREFPTPEELELLERVYPNAMVKGPRGPLNLHTVVREVEALIEEGDTIVLFDTVGNARLFCYLMQQHVPFGFIEPDNTQALRMFFVENGVLTTVEQVS